MRKSQGFNLSAIGFLISANIILFIATTISQDLIWDLGLSRNTFTEEPWRIITSLFVHGGIWHILANMMTLYFFGTYVSRIVGENKFLIIYFLGGILGNVFYMLLGNPAIPVIGASGAVFAVGGTLTVLLPKLRVMIFPIPAPLPIWIAITGIFVLISFFPDVAWQAHLGGLLFGLVAGYFFRRRRRYLF